MAMMLYAEAHAQYFFDDDSVSIYGVEDEVTGINAVDFSTLKMPPLTTLFENARTNARILSLDKDRQIELENLRKERIGLLKYISVRGSYSYGIMDNYGTASDVMTPIYYQYVGSKQSYWNVGGSVSVPLDKAFEYRRDIKRQKLKMEQAKLLVEQEYDRLKLEIVQLYVRINNNIVALHAASENAAAYKSAGVLNNEEFVNGRISVRELAETRRWENDAVGKYQNLQSVITSDILTLEILTHTPIITNVLTDMEFKDDTKKKKR